MKDYLPDSFIQPLPGFAGNGINVDMLRLDRLHPVVSGNKWFKLKYYLKEAKAQGKTTLTSFGGAYSNHIVAAAFACREAGLKSIGLIRGGEQLVMSPTLEEAHYYGMQLQFIDRTTFRNKEMLIEAFHSPDIYWVNEGGYGSLGARGAADILNFETAKQYTHICCAAGTGTMVAGLINASEAHQHIIGVSVLKNHYSLEKEVHSLLTNKTDAKNYSLIHGHHFGGYAKHPDTLIRFMHELWEKWQLPTDIVYTSKLVFAVRELVTASYFPANSKLLIIHSGGLQGNRSLPPDCLPF